MKLNNYKAAGKTKATITFVDATNKKVHFVVGDAHSEYSFEGDAPKVKLLATVTIDADGTVTPAGVAQKVKDAVQKAAPASGSGAAYNKQY
jgi:hypothetical protein